MKDKSKVIIIILALVIIGLVGYICYDKVLKDKDKNDGEETVEVKHDSLETVLHKISGYWRVPSENSLVVMSFEENGNYGNFYYASEGGVGGKVKGLTYDDKKDEYILTIELNPRLLCTEEYCEEGATIGQYSDPEEIKLTLNFSKFGDKILIVDNKELRYLGSTYSEMEENIYK